MNTFDRHLLREWLQILGVVLLATCGLLVVNVMLSNFQDLRTLGAPGWMFVEYVGAKLPSFLALALPLGLLVSLLYTLGLLHRANEITAMRAAGVSILRITAPIWVAGALCCGLTWLLNATAVPWSLMRSRSITESLQFQDQAKHALPADHRGAEYGVTFDNARERRIWYFNRFSRYTGHGYGVSVSELDSDRHELKRVLAAEAWPEPGRGGWVFKRGHELTFSPDSGIVTRSKSFQTLFRRGYDERPSLMLLTERDPVELSLHELRQLIAYLKAEGDPKVVPYAVRYFGLIANTVAPLIVIAIAIPFAVTGVRVNPAVGVSKSIGLFALYYIMAQFAESLAIKGIVDAQFAAWMPNIGTTAIALWFFSRMR